MNSVDGEVSMSSIQRIFQKSIFLITITCLLITLTDVKCSGFSEGKSTEAESLPLKTVRILSLDGGGVRGISEARFLEHLLHSSLKCNTVNIFLKDLIWRKPS